MNTPFATIVESLRVQRRESMRELADALGVSQQCLSAVLCGRKNVPNSWVDIIAHWYKLSDEEAEMLQKAAKLSRTSQKIVLHGSSTCKRELALCLSRNIDAISEETAEKLCRILHTELQDQDRSLLP